MRGVQTGSLAGGRNHDPGTRSEPRTYGEFFPEVEAPIEIAVVCVFFTAAVAFFRDHIVGLFRQQAHPEAFEERLRTAVDDAEGAAAPEI